MRKIGEIKNYLTEGINQNEILSKKREKVCRVLNYIENSFIAVSTITGCFSISAFASLVGIPIGITSSAIVLKICIITAGIKNHKLIIKKKKKYDRSVLLAKSELNNIEVLISKASIIPNINLMNSF